MCQVNFCGIIGVQQAIYVQSAALTASHYALPTEEATAPRWASWCVRCLSVLR